MRENSDLYNQACEIITRALDAAEGERDAIIQLACGDNAPLRREVDWLYDECQRTVTNVLDGVARIPNQYDVEPPPADLRVAAAREYVIVRELGRGGMGVVYLAERRDADYVQSVALKLLTANASDTPEVARRFLAERQILAELSHPNIAHLVDGGRLPDGRPFIAMEYVDGQRVDEFCVSNALSVPQRLRLFMSVCAAVHYAHQHLVIHRDLKPANIFVTAEGRPKLLDFGIARIVGQKPHIVSAETVEGHAPLTLAYASPEQVEGKPLTTGSDIYSLGVLLYELLSGSHPYPRDVPAVELARYIREVDPKPPSSADRTSTARGTTTQRWWVRSNPIMGDLDAIVLKAMRKIPTERYQTAAEFAHDIGAHLDGKPVFARRGEGWYRARKFVSRNRYAVGALVFTTLLLALFAVGSSYQLKKTEAALAVSEKMTGFFTGIFNDTTPLGANGQETSAHAVLTRATENVATALPGEDRAKLKLYAALGDALQMQASFADADHALTLGLALAESSPDSDAQTRAQFLASLAWLRIRQSQYSAAGELAQRALAVLDEAHDNESYNRGLALRDLAISKLETDAPLDDVVSLLTRALAFQNQIGASDHQKSQTHNLTARAYLQHDHYDDALRELDQALALIPADETTVRADFLTAKANTLRQAGRPREAQAVFEEIRPILENVYRDTPVALAQFYRQYASSDMQLGRFHHAAAMYERLAEQCKAIPCEEVPERKFDRLLGYGRALAGLREFAHADELFAEASIVADGLPSATSAAQEISVRTARATALVGDRQYDRALRLLDEATPIAAGTGEHADGWQRLIEKIRLDALIGAQRWELAERELTTNLASTTWESNATDLDLEATEIAAGERRWADVVREAPKIYVRTTTVWGPCNEEAKTLREGWKKWSTESKLPPVPDSDVRCND